MKILFILSIFFSLAFSDEIRPAYLELTQVNETSFKVLWKKPSQGEAKEKLLLEPVFFEGSKLLGIKHISKLNGLIFETYVIEETLVGKVITIKGLEFTSSDVLVRVYYLDGETEFLRVLPEHPSFILEHKGGFLAVASTYTFLGIEHILFGFDHLLFVLALLLLVTRLKTLILTITSFTLAHTITLALASLNLLHVSSRAVEAIIALSIVFVAAEVIYFSRGKQYLAIKYPWAIAFGFGLIHGLGFAGALKEIGLPSNDIITALLFFNVGVEVGQLFFVLMVLILFYLANKVYHKSSEYVKVPMAYGVGIVSMFWLIQRVF